MNVFRLTLIVLLMLTSQSLAAARGQTRIAGQHVLCSGGALTTIYVDYQGKPVQRLLICPDMALALMAGVASPPVIIQREIRSFLLSYTFLHPDEAESHLPSAQARSPPSCLDPDFRHMIKPQVET
ncbi:hypothetical protein [Paracoccus aerodenitrificans]|uniref:hypothetical protein n=1 Tax=Paracoccus aerodenitrificans TaxID=3017781 RepID=UPI0022F0AE0D|nr:hypothetical protein [Paracoccus aerodenitrificans]WBU63243.1 hypothetical protein PAE61_12865 [Paracoccus aerodenitrificans]